MDLSKFSSKLKCIDNIWYLDTNIPISYPNDGNDFCFKIEEQSFWFLHRNNCILEVVRTFNKNSVFFDIGGGNGFVAKSLENIGIESVLIEPGGAGVLNAKNRGVRNIICSTLDDLKFNDNSVESIGIFDVIEHIENDFDFLKTIHKVLEINGKLFITVPTYRFLWSNEDINAGHYRRYTKKSITKLLKKNGFDVVYASYFFSILPIPIFIFRSLPSIIYSIFNINKSKRNEENDHNYKSGLLSFLISRIWKLELSFISKKRNIPFGSSCIIVAEKKL